MKFNFFKKRKKDTSYLDEIEELNQYENEYNNNSNISNEETMPSNEILPNENEEIINLNLKDKKNSFFSIPTKNSLTIKIASSVLLVSFALYFVSPMVIDVLKQQGVMNNEEFNATIEEVDKIVEIDSSKQLDKLKESKKNKKEALDKEKIEKSVEKELNETKNIENVNNNLQNESLQKSNETIENKENKENLNNKVEVLDKNNINKIDNSNSIKPQEEKENLAIGKNYINKDGEVIIDKMEKSIDAQIDSTVKKIEKTNLEHKQDDLIDPFAQEYSGTIKSRAMSVELEENIKLMKGYIAYLDTRKAFDAAKLEFDKEKKKNLFEDEINQVKDAVLVEVKDMKKELETLKSTNENLTKQLANNSKDKELNNLKSMDEEIANRKMVISTDVSQKIYKIGFNYLLEEKDTDGNVKVYRDGNAYRGYKIIQITPDFLKVKSENGVVSILPINAESNNNSGYSKVSIPTPQKIEVENENNSKTTKTQNVENYSTKQNNYREESIKKANEIEQNREKQLKSRFLN